MKGKALIIFFACLMACTACSKTTYDQADGIPVMVSIPPQAYVVRQIGNVLVNVSVMLGAGKDPHTYEPAPSDITRLSLSVVYFTTGMPYEKTVLDAIKGTRARLMTVDMSAGIRRIPLSHDHTGHSAKAGAEEMDPHVWLSPLNLIIMARNTCDALVKVDPGHRDAYELNLRAFEIEMNTLHRQLSSSMAPFKGERFYTFHPSFGYFAKTYGLEQMAIEIEGKGPASRDIENVTEKAREDAAAMIIVQPQFDEKSAEVVAKAANARIVTIDPLAPDVYSTLTTLGMHMTSLFSQKAAR